MRGLDPRLLRRARAARAALVADSLLAVLSALLVLAQGVLLARVVARAFSGASLAQVETALALLVVVVMGRAGAMWGFEVVGRRAAAEVLSQLRLGVLERRLRDRPAALDGVDSAEVATAAVAGVDALEGTFARYLPQMVLAVVVPVAVIAVVASVDPVSAVLMFLTLPLVPLFMWLVGRYTQRRTRQRWQALVLLATHFLDVVRGLPTLRAFNRGSAQSKRIGEVGDAYRRATMSTLRVSFLSGAVLEFAAMLGIALVAVTVGVRLVGGGLGLETGLTVLVLTPELYLPLRNLGAQYHASADGLAVAERLLDLMEEGVATSSRTVMPPDARAAVIRLEGVSFTYPARIPTLQLADARPRPRPDPALDAVDLELWPGETVALVGPSGAGKSTIASLLLGLAEPTRGRVSVGEIDLPACDLAAWRAQMAWVPQHPTLFRSTVADNIRLGLPDATCERVRAAAVHAGADRFIRALPHGYETVVGDGGRPLSAGQLQRIALARAFLREASLVVLDEPTANIDPESAALVFQTIRRLQERRTVLLITHSRKLAALADRMVWMKAGQVVDVAAASERGLARVRASASEPVGGDPRVRASASEPVGGDPRVGVEQ